MNIIPQILNLSSKNLIINSLLSDFKNNLHKILDNFMDNLISNKYLNITLCLQQLLNNLSISFLESYIKCVDDIFRNSKKRKEKFFINKSNVKRTIVTIFGELSFTRTLYINKSTGEYYFYVDDVLNIDKYKTYDPIVRAILVNDATFTNPTMTSTHSSLDCLNLKSYLNDSSVLNIPRNTIYRFKRDIKIRKVKYEDIPTKKTLYVMVDEKWIHKQDKKNPKNRKYIMAKCFVTFTGIENKGNRNKLLGRHIFMTTSDKPWKEFMNEVYKIYDFEKIENINLLSDAGSWILSGKNELKLYSNNKVTVNTCEFHVKQKIYRSTTDKELREKISKIIYENEDKKEFDKEMDKIIDSKTTESRKQKVTEYKKYILNHWKGIINMKYSMCKSSMESHIQHCISSYFSSVPKAYSSNNIESYLKVQEMQLNGINILKYYLNTYNSNEDYVYNDNKKEISFSLFENPISSNIPIKCSSNPISCVLNNIAYSFTNF